MPDKTLKIRQSNVFNSLMTQWSEAEGVMERTQEASGAMASAYELYTDSIEGRINTLKATLQGLSSDILDDSVIKTAISGLTGIANALDFVIDKIGILGTLAIGGGIAKFVSDFNLMQTSIVSASSALSGISGGLGGSNIIIAANEIAKYKNNIRELILAKTTLTATDKAYALQVAQDIATNKIIVAEKAKEISLYQIQNARVKESVASSVAATIQNNIEKIGLDGLTEAQLRHILATHNISNAKQEEIIAHLTNAGAIKTESTAMTALGGAFKGILSLLKNPLVIVTGLIFGIVTATKEYTKALRENAKEAQQNYQQITSEVESLESELANVQERLEELNKIESPTYVQQEEIDKLTELNNELERELLIKQAQQDFAKKDAENTALKSFRDYQSKNALVDYETGNLIGNPEMEDYLNAYVEAIRKQQETYDIRKQEFDELVLDPESSKRDRDNAEKILGYAKEELDARYKRLDEFLRFAKDEWSGITGETEEGKRYLEQLKYFEDNIYIPLMEEYNGKEYNIEIDTNLNTDGIDGQKKELEDLSDAIDKVIKKADILNNVQKDLSDKNIISASTIKDILQMYPSMEQAVTKYLLGLTTASQLMSELKAKYAEDEAAYYDLLINKIMLTDEFKEVQISAEYEKQQQSEKFFESLNSMQQNLINALGDSYNVDLENFTTIEKKKIEIQAAVIKTLALQYTQYAGLSLEELKAQQKILNSKISPGVASSPSAKPILDELNAVNNAIKEIEDIYSKMDAIANSGNLIKPIKPTDLSSVKDSVSKKTDDTLKKLHDKINDWFSGIELQISLKIDKGDIDGAKKLYQDAINRANEELNKAYSSGLTISDEWVQSLLEKLQKYHKEFSELIINEYDKLIEYNDDFDVWNKVSYSKLDVLADKLKKINDLYLEGILSYKDWYDLYMDTAKEIYDYQKDALEELLDQTMDAIKAENDARVEALENQKDAYNEIISLKKKLIEDTDEEADYEREVAKRVKEIAKLQERITQLALDDSREAYAERVKLEEELQQKQEELADYQADHAKDQVIDSLDEQQDKFEENIDEQIDSIKAEIDTEVELREQAINRINADYKKMMEDVKGYFAELGITLDDEVIRRLEEGLKLVSQYGDYGSAIGGIGSGSDIGSATGYELTSLIQQMKNNSSAWWDAKNSGNKEEMNRLSQENERIAQMLKTMFGLDIWKDSASGTWYIRTPGGKQKLFDVYHNGGVVDGYSTTNNREIMALLEKGEVVFNDGQQKKFVDIFKDAAIKMQKVFSNIFAIATETSNFSPIPAGATYAPSISVNIEHNGPMTDDDANKYANQIGNGTFDVLMEIMNRKGII